MVHAGCVQVFVTKEDGHVTLAEVPGWASDAIPAVCVGEDRYPVAVVSAPARRVVPMPRKGSNTPWGHAQDVREIAPGIILIDTPGHGGYWLTPDRLSGVRSKFPNLVDTFAGFPWFEEDCDWRYVVLTFPECFDAGNVDGARLQHEAMAARDLAEAKVSA